MDTDLGIRFAQPNEASIIASLLGMAFEDDPVSRWLFPDELDRRLRHPSFFRVFVDHALAGGTVWLTRNRDAAALWLPVDPRSLAGEDAQKAMRAQLENACGSAAARFAILDEAMSARHPVRDQHQYLPFIGVAPSACHRGVGTALLRHHLSELDRIAVPAYLEASSADNWRLYVRLGFTPLGEPIDLPGGPSLWPMWRLPLSTSGPSPR